ncbi:MAG: radical SAM protein [Candidatus Diapherotrites archaeon]|nr:radical SAM protein [Candidatus Diapherotrites archaeon]
MKEKEKNRQKRKNFKIALLSVDDIEVLGIRYLSSALRQKGFETRLVFLPPIDNNYSKPFTEDVIKQVLNEVKNAELVGITCVAMNRNKAIQIIKEIKNAMPEKPVIWGGVYATTSPQECIKHAGIVCIGEGEEAFAELVEKMNEKKAFTKTRNMWFRKNGKIIKNPVRPPVCVLDSLPFPDYDIKEQLVLENHKLVQLEERHFCGKLNVHTARGCPHKCTYCGSNFFRQLYAGLGPIIRKRSAKGIIQELNHSIERLPNTKLIWFTDDVFFVRSIEELKEFAKEYKKEIKIPFQCYVSPLTINEEKLKILLDAGLCKVEMGIQTGSERLNKEVYDRNIPNSAVLNAAKILNKYAERMELPNYQIINSSPFETEQDKLETIRLLQELPKPYIHQSFNMAFFPGTELYNRALNEGIIGKDDFASSDMDYGSQKEVIKHINLKKKNKYLNYLTWIMSGVVTKRKYGTVPSIMVPVLTSKPMMKIGPHLTFVFPMLYSIFEKTVKLKRTLGLKEIRQAKTKDLK